MPYTVNRFRTKYLQYLLQALLHFSGKNSKSSHNLWEDKVKKVLVKVRVTKIPSQSSSLGLDFQPAVATAVLLSPHLRGWK